MNPFKLLLLFASFSLLSACNWASKPESHDPVEKISADTIRVYKDALENLKVEKARLAPFPDLLSLMGKISITEDRTTIMPARVAGRIENIFFASGEKVEQGQIVATLFSPDFISAKEEYLLSIKKEKQADNSTGSNGSFAADPSDFANLAQMSRKKLETMGLSPGDIDGLANSPTTEPEKALLSVRAPRSGVLIQKNAVLGNFVNVGDTLFMIGDMSKVWFSGDIYPEDLPKVHKGQDVFINAVGISQSLYGKVSFVSPLVDPSTRSIKIRALMDNPNLALKSDEYVQGNVVLAQKDALIVPTSSIVRTPEGTVAFKRITVGSRETAVASLDFKRISVNTGNEQGGMTAITSGISEGDEIISDGALLLESAINSTDSKEGK